MRYLTLGGNVVRSILHRSARSLDKLSMGGTLNDPPLRPRFCRWCKKAKTGTPKFMLAETPKTKILEKNQLTKRANCSPTDIAKLYQISDVYLHSKAVCEGVERR